MKLLHTTCIFTVVSLGLALTIGPPVCTIPTPPGCNKIIACLQKRCMAGQTCSLLCGTCKPICTEICKKPIHCDKKKACQARKCLPGQTCKLLCGICLPICTGKCQPCLKRKCPPGYSCVHDLKKACSAKCCKTKCNLRSMLCRRRKCPIGHVATINNCSCKCECKRKIPSCGLKRCRPGLKCIRDIKDNTVKCCTRRCIFPAKVCARKKCGKGEIPTLNRCSCRCECKKKCKTKCKLGSSLCRRKKCPKGHVPTFNKCPCKCECKKKCQPCSLKKCPPGLKCVPDLKSCTSKCCTAKCIPSPFACRRTKCLRGEVSQLNRCSCKCECKKTSTCLKPCTKILKPVCGTDGKTYSNSCVLEIAMCQSKGKLKLRHPGRCKINIRLGCPKCSSILRPVCGSDGKTYRNSCLVAAANCNSAKNIKVVKSGPCIAVN